MTTYKVYYRYVFEEHIMVDADSKKEAKALFQKQINNYPTSGIKDTILHQIAEDIQDDDLSEMVKIINVQEY